VVELGDMGIGEQVLSVRQLTMVVSETIALIPTGLVVEGEVQKVRIYKEFMIFFELAGEGQSINCFTTFGDLKGELPEEGSKAQVLGEVSLGKKTELRFKVREFRSAGQAGDNAKKLEELKIKLRAEGAFDESRKRSLPKFPKKVAVITSGGSSAWEDFKRISSSRFLAAEIELFSSSVQGDLAVQEICSKLAEVGARAQEFDVIAIVRGGGARGDLEAFNSEEIARMVLASSIPVVSGVGHEDDVSLVDLVADKRASTPSNAAEIIFPDSKDLFKLVESLKQKASIAMDSRLRFVELELASLRDSLNQSIYYYLGNLEAKLNLSKARLESLDFEKLFAKGFAYLERGGKAVVSVSDVKSGDLIFAKLADGQLELEVK
jgi:exodeoxyribonuclease VII large subunit